MANDAKNAIKQKRGEALLAELNGKLDDQSLDPVTELAKLATDVNTPLVERIKILRDLAQYQFPKRKSIEIGNADTEGFVVRVKRFSAEDATTEVADKKFNEGGLDELVKET
jgi:hypothetical protein